MDAGAVPSVLHNYTILSSFCFDFLTIIIQLLIIKSTTSSLLD